MQEDELGAILTRLVAELETEHAAERSRQRLTRQLERNRTLLVDQFFADLVFGRLTDPPLIVETATRLRVETTGSPSYVVVVDVRSGDVDRLFASVEALAPMEAGAKSRYLRGYSEIVVVTRPGEAGMKETVDRLVTLCEQLGVQACICVSAAVDSLDQIGARYRWARDAAVKHEPVAPVDVIAPADDTATDIVAERSVARRYRRVVQEVVDLIETSFMDEMLSVVTLADAVSLSPNYMATLFKSEVGRTVHQYLLAVRLERAKQLLKNPRYRMYEVANAVGYGNANYFSKMFKKETGVSPREFRESAL